MSLHWIPLSRRGFELRLRQASNRMAASWRTTRSSVLNISKCVSKSRCVCILRRSLCENVTKTFVYQTRISQFLKAHSSISTFFRSIVIRSIFQSPWNSTRKGFQPRTSATLSHLHIFRLAKVRWSGFFVQWNKRYDSLFFLILSGLRKCIGGRFGLLQTKMSIAKLVANFDISANKSTLIPMEYAPPTLFLTPKRAIHLLMKRI